MLLTQARLIKKKQICSLVSSPQKIQLPDIDIHQADCKDNNSSEDNEPANSIWFKPKRRELHFPFTETSGINPTYAAALAECTPFETYIAFVSDSIIDKIVLQINLYATQILANFQDISNMSKLHTRVPTNQYEIKKIYLD